MSASHDSLILRNFRKAVSRVETSGLSMDDLQTAVTSGMLAQILVMVAARYRNISTDGHYVKLMTSAKLMVHGCRKYESKFKDFKTRLFVSEAVVESSEVRELREIRLGLQGRSLFVVGDTDDEEATERVESSAAARAVGNETRAGVLREDDDE